MALAFAEKQRRYRERQTVCGYPVGEITEMSRSMLKS